MSNDGRHQQYSTSRFQHLPVLRAQQRLSGNVYAEVRRGRLPRKIGKKTIITDRDGRTWLANLPLLETCGVTVRQIGAANAGIIARAWGRR
jgi:hypothetical protein